MDVPLLDPAPRPTAVQVPGAWGAPSAIPWDCTQDARLGNGLNWSQPVGRAVETQQIQHKGNWGQDFEGSHSHGARSLSFERGDTGFIGEASHGAEWWPMSTDASYTNYEEPMDWGLDATLPPTYAA